MTKIHGNKIIAIVIILTWTMFCSPVRHARAAADKLNIAGFIGTSSTSAASRVNVVLYSKDKDKIVDSVQTNFFGRYKFEDVEPGTYLIKVGKMAKEVVIVKKSMRIDIDLSASDGTMDYAKGAASGTAAQPVGPNDETLMQAMAAEYYHYSGSTERKVMLCPDGRFLGSSESSYSGTSRDGLGNENLAWGTASQGRSGGRWTVQGTQTQGTIILSGNDGKQSQVKYQSTGERGCYSFNGNTFCVSGPARCQ
jgi:hypothetical protein